MDVDLLEIRSLLAELILEERIQGQIDQVNGVLELRGGEIATAQKHTAIRKWADALVDINKRLHDKIQGLGMSGGGRGGGHTFDAGDFGDADRKSVV